jgi:SAM-dependent methyltransferase
MYVAFAMSTVGRGRDIFSLLENHSCIRAKNRYLDVGTGYGGFLRAFKESGFKEVIGIELQPHLVNLAQANIVGLQGAQVLKGDFVKEDFSSLGTFDIITCNDVIEHVDDPVLTIQKLSALINDDGCISFEVPNKDCIAFVKSDGHFQIFGITQLLKDDAADYYAACLGNKKSGYYFEMGEMYELEWYIEKLAENGLSAFMADTHVDGKIEDVPILIADLKQAYRTWQAEKQPNLELGIAQKVASAVEKYMRELELAFTALTDDTSKRRFIDKYLRSFWTIIASRNLPQ